MAELSAIGSSGLPVVNQLALPADVRSGTPKQKQAYAAALGFERMLLGQLTQTLASTASPAGSDGSGDDSSGGSSDGSGPGDAATSIYQQMLPGQLADAMTAAGGVGVADELYRSIGGK